MSVNLLKSRRPPTFVFAPLFDDLRQNFRVAFRRKSSRTVATPGIGLLADGGIPASRPFRCLNPDAGPTAFGFVVSGGDGGAHDPCLVCLACKRSAPDCSRLPHAGSAVPHSNPHRKRGRMRGRMRTTLLLTLRIT